VLIEDQHPDIEEANIASRGIPAQLDTISKITDRFKSWDHRLMTDCCQGSKMAVDRIYFMPNLFLDYS
jgi:hypothetical protein